MKTITIRVEDRVSAYYPIGIYFKINKVEYGLVFENMADVERYCRRFYPHKVIYHDNRKARSAD